MKINRYILVSAALAAVIAASGFYFYLKTAGGKTALLWTDRQELISIVESYNAASESSRIKIVYTSDPAIATVRAGVKPDIVIGSYLNSPRIIDSFRRLDHLLKNERIESSSFYSELLEKGQRKERQYLLPVSFKLPALMFRRGDVSQTVSSFMVTEDNIIELSSSFRDAYKDRPQSVSPFSPRWDSSMLYYSAVMNKADFRVNENNLLLWNNGGIETALEKARTFIRDINGGFENERVFHEKYITRPFENLITEQRIFFAYTDLGRFYSLSQEKRNNLNFRWLSNNGLIPVCDDVIYAGIPRQAANRKSAEDFLEWFFSYQAQETFIEEARAKRIRSFGVCGGFSSIRLINEQVFPRHYPLLVGHIPPEFVLSFPDPLPADWETIKSNVIEKWLYLEAGNENTQSSLADVISAWYRLHPGF